MVESAPPCVHLEFNELDADADRKRPPITPISGVLSANQTNMFQPRNFN